MIKWITDLMNKAKERAPMDDILNHVFSVINPEHRKDRDKLKGNAECHHCTKRLTTWSREYAFQRCVCLDCAELNRKKKEMDMIPLTERIEEIEKTSTDKMTPELFSELVNLRNAQNEQSLKGGPVPEHHDIRKSRLRSKL